MSAVTVGIVIPCLNEGRWLGEVLDAISSQTHEPDEIVVVDDGSTDDTAAVAHTWAAKHPALPLRVVPGPRRGVAAAVCAGVDALSSDVFIRLDGHCRPAADYISRAVTLLEGPKVGVVGGVWVIEPGDDSIEALAIAIGMAHPIGSGGAAYRRASLHEAIDVDTVPFGCFKRPIWLALGGFDQGLRSNEDYEFNYRLRQQGLRVVLDPGMRCTYYARPTIRELARQYGRYGWWKARMLIHHPRSVRWRQLVPALLVPGFALIAAGMVAAPGPFWTMLLALYPAAILGFAVQAAVARGKPMAAGWTAATFATIHLTWSASFWSSLVSAGVSRLTGRS